MPGAQGKDKGELQSRKTLKAVVLADSFNQRFRPITVERPAVLLPLANVPLLEYALEWLAASSVEEVLVFCCAHAAQITHYLENSKWQSVDFMKITPIVAKDCLSAGDSLRFLDQLHIIKSDFILMSGTTVTNVRLGAALDAHRKRRAADPTALMTMVMMANVSPSHRQFLGEADLVVGMDPSNNRLLKYDESDGGRRQAFASLDARLFGERDVVQVRSDLVNSSLYICAPEVLLLFSDNFDYQNLHHDFVCGVLSEEELGNKIFLHPTHNEYAVPVNNLRTYDAVSRDIVHKWMYPFVADTRIFARGDGAGWYKCSRGNVYIDKDVRMPASSRVGPAAVVAQGTVIGQNSHIRESVIGHDCRIGDGVEIVGCYIEGNVVIESNAKLLHAMVCENVVVRQGATVSKGCILSFNVVIGTQHTVPPYSRISLCHQSQEQPSDSEDDLEYSPAADAGKNSVFLDEEDTFDRPSSFIERTAFVLGHGGALQERPQFDDEVVGLGGAGFRWTQRNGLDDNMFSFAAPAKDDDRNDGSASEDSSEDTLEDGIADRGEVDKETLFERDVTETFLRCIKMKCSQDTVRLELNGLKFAENRTFADCAKYVFTGLLSLCQPASDDIKPEYRALFPHEPFDLAANAGKEQLLARLKTLLTEWRPLLRKFLRSEDDQVELLFTFEEYWGAEGVFDRRGHPGNGLTPIVPNVCEVLYDTEIVSEEAFLAWADEKKDASTEDKRFLEQANSFIEWLRNAESEEDDGEEEEGSEEESDDGE